MQSHLRCLIFGLLALAAAGAQARDFEVGQIWSYKTRPQEPNSTLMILRIDSSSAPGPVVFIGVTGLTLRHPYGGMVSSLSPLPFTKAALEQSVVKLVGTTDRLMPSDFGYAKWKEAQRAGKSPPTYAKPVAEIMNDLENGYIGIPPPR